MEFKILPSNIEACENISGEPDQPLLLEKNENSDLIAVSKPISQEFFEKVFSPKGPYWKIYSELGIEMPSNSRYVAFINGQMYFIKNTEYKYLDNFGPQTSISIKESKLIVKKELNIHNLILFLGMPLDAAKQMEQRIKLGFYANESIIKFEEFREKSLKFYEHYRKEQNIKNPVDFASDCADYAIEALSFSNMALFSHIQKIKVKTSESIQICEAEIISELINKGDYEGVKERFGFYSLSPYNITEPRFRETIKDLKSSGFPEPPKEYLLKWRENAKYICARYLDLMRISLKQHGKASGLNELVFYLTIPELQKGGNALKDLAKKRRALFEKYSNASQPSKMLLLNGKLFPLEEKKIFKATSASSKKTVSGPAININKLDEYKKCQKGSIIVSKSLSPNISILFRKAAGIISENGGTLSHSALIAREMGIPCLVQVPSGLQIRDGEFIEINGKTGEIRKLQKPAYTSKSSPEKQQEKAASNKKFKKTSKDIIVFDGKNINGIGAKAGNLCLLSKEFNVPPAFCITDRMFQKARSISEVDMLSRELALKGAEDIGQIEAISQKIKKKITSYEFSPEFIQELSSNICKLGIKNAAVRSSSTSEDRKNASFAGQFDSYLNVKGLENIKKAIKKCWASFFNTRTIIYRIQNNLPEAEGLNVIVQQMINAEYSGVMFTKDPDGKKCMRIEVVKGACENIVSGKAIPNSYSADRRNFSIKANKEEFGFDAEKIRQIAAIGMKIEKVFGCPQDIEWAIDHKKKIWVLQARPITAFSKQ